ncbi:phage protease [Pseudomonas mandelii]|uniref:Peptidase n=1 Tax=Pseudomonas mandelii TaxID=75612 RepID=A0A502IBG5_9PSED|nr:phage protease [Pseudomonas mandelii]TPG82590.1 hypothetical protein EAH74_17065 [Pseudomonas mandelii]
MKPLHIFKPGTHTAMCGTSFNFTESDLSATVAAYNPSLHEAPMGIGHPQHDAPAAGWIKSLSATTQGLIAEPQQVDATFAEQIAKGSYKKISASFYHPDAANNPVPGVYYLRHVGFLGAQPPSVKGLRPIELADDEQGVIEFSDHGHYLSADLWRRFREWLISQFNKDTADHVAPSWAIDSLADTARQPEQPMATFTQPKDLGDLLQVEVSPGWPRSKATPLAGTDNSLGQMQAKVAGKYRFNHPRGAVLLAYGKSTFGVSESTDAAYVQPTQR